MLVKRLALFARALGSKALKINAVKARSLYTDPIYPYPNNYIHTKLYPSQFVYRENYIEPKWIPLEQTCVRWGMRFFWFYIFYSLFNDPGVIIGHNTYPEPDKWTDEELGIPPMEAGSYKDWLAAKGDPLDSED